MLVSKNFGDLVSFTRASAGWSFSAGGVLVPSAANSPRLDYDSVALAARGLLIEEQRTNLALNSDSFTNWNIQGATLSAPMVAAPDGGQSRKLVSATTPSTVAQVYQTSANTPTTVGASYALSVYAKAGEYTAAYLNTNLAGSFGSAVFDLTNGATKASAGLTAAMAQIGNGWWRCSVVGVAANAATQIAVGGASDFAGAAPGTGPAGNSVFDGVSGLYVWRVQFELGAFSTSAIPTTSAQATRAADGAIIADLSRIGFNPGEGTIYAEVEVPNPSVATARGIISIDDATESNRLTLTKEISGKLGFASVIGGAGSVILASAANMPAGPVKVAAAYKAGDFAMCLGGAVAVTSGAGALPAGLSTMRLGMRSSGGAFNGWLRNVRYFPRRMTNAELQTMTT